GDADQPGIDYRIGPITRDRRLQQSSGAKLAHQRTAGRVDVAAMRIAKTGCKCIERPGVFAVSGIEERPREMFARRPAQLRNRGHVSLPQRPLWRTPPGAARVNNVSWLKYPVKR